MKFQYSTLVVYEVLKCNIFLDFHICYWLYSWF